MKTKTIIAIAAILFAACKKESAPPTWVKQDHRVYYGNVCFYCTAPGVTAMRGRVQGQGGGVVITTSETGTPTCDQLTRVSIQEGVATGYTFTNYYDSTQVWTGTVTVSRDECRVIGVK